MNKIKENAQEILNLYNYFNGAIIFDGDAVAVYYYNNRPDINDMTEEDVVGKHISEIYPDLNLEKSSIMEALTKGVPTANMLQTWTTVKGQTVKSINTTVPIFEEGQVIGAAEVSRYVTGKDDLVNIYVTPVISSENRKMYTLDDIKSQWTGMGDIKKIISKVSETDSSVLIYGKTGTGKELAAEAIHAEGKRCNKRFVAQNCAAIPASLLESIIFGTVRGGFTGAEDRTGLMEVCNGGTLFLDEINSMDISLQAKLLKAIEEQMITRVGGIDPIPVDVRIIAASNEDPWEMVKSGRLREDLYYRLKVVQIDLPSLRERKGDIEFLTGYFIKKYNKVFGKNIQGLSNEVRLFFEEYPWPGNIRELQNTIEGCFNFASGPLLKMEDISWYKESCAVTVPEPELTGTLKETVKQYEKHLIEREMEACRDLQQVAERLGISRQNLNNKIKEYSLDEE